MQRRTFLQALTATFAGLFTWGAPKIEKVVALPRQILEVPKKIQRYFVETRYAERVVTPVEEFEKVALPNMSFTNKPEYGYIVGRVLNPSQHRGVNIADDAAFDEATKYGCFNRDICGIDTGPGGSTCVRSDAYTSIGQHPISDALVEEFNTRGDTLLEDDPLLRRILEGIKS